MEQILVVCGKFRHGHGSGEILLSKLIFLGILIRKRFQLALFCKALHAIVIETFTFVMELLSIWQYCKSCNIGRLH